jgi:4,5-dihydroxyphthalate decarboxylase
MMELSIGFHPNPRIRPLIDGEVSLDGTNLNWTFATPNRLHLRQQTANDLDVFEISIDRLLTRRLAGHDDWVGLPVFSTMSLSQAQFLVRESSGIRRLDDLAGKRFAIPLYQMSSMIWLRAALRVLIGIAADEIVWVVAPQHEADGTLQWLVEPPPPGANVSFAPDRGAMEMLTRGEVDAAFLPLVQPEHRPEIRPVLGASECRDLWLRFRRETGAVPINHAVGMQRKVIEADPTLPKRLFEVMEASKEIAYRRARAEAPGLLVFSEVDIERQAEDFGSDPYPFGLEENSRSLSVYCDQLVHDRIIGEVPDLATIFLDPLRPHLDSG